VRCVDLSILPIALIRHTVHSRCPAHPGIWEILAKTTDKEKSMPMPLPANAVTIGDNAYLFPSPSCNPVTDCFIMGHGGTPNDPKIDDRYFTVPAGCTVNFFVGGGKANKMSEGPVNGFKVMVGQNGGQAPEISPGNSVGGGKNCRDYILAKAVGSHWKADPGFDDYTRITKP
jgi:hypothetical protein